MTGSQQRPVRAGASASIKERQDRPPHLQRLLAYSHLYQVAQRWRRVRTVGAFALAASAPVFTIYLPAEASIRGAISAGWLVIGRLLLSGLEQNANLQAARVQELYDTELFRLPWNQALAGRRPTPDDVASASRHIKNQAPYLDWYSIDLGDTPWPGDVLLCQRQSAVWSRRDHRAYGVFIMLVSAAWSTGIIALALARDMSLTAFLISLFLPSAPAISDAMELARTHWRQSTARRQVEDDAHDVWEQYRNSPVRIPVDACRRIQDAAFLLRRDSPGVPNWFYKVRKGETAIATSAGTEALRSLNQGR
jgi:hypothetical protein